MPDQWVSFFPKIVWKDILQYSWTKPNVNAISPDLALAPIYPIYE